MPLLRDLEPVAANLADPRTRLDRFFRELGDAAAEAAPVAEQQASLFVNLDVTFTALAAIARPYLQESISEGPPTEEVGIRDFALQRPFLRNNTALFRELRPGVATLPHSAPILADAFEAGTAVLLRTVRLNDDLADVFEGEHVHPRVRPVEGEQGEHDHPDPDRRPAHLRTEVPAGEEQDEDGDGGEGPGPGGVPEIPLVRTTKPL